MNRNQYVHVQVLIDGVMLTIAIPAYLNGITERTIDWTDKVRQLCQIPGAFVLKG